MNTLIQPSNLFGPAQRIDRLGLVTLLSGLYFFQLWALKLTYATGIWSVVVPAMIAISIVSVLIPRLHGLLALNALVWVAFYLSFSPISSNNQLTSFAFALVVCGAYLAALTGGRSDDAREALFQTIAGPGRYVLAAMYFFGIYHKINADFLTPEVSCAVVLYAPLAAPFGLASWSVGQYAAIYATFVIEGFAMIALFLPRWKRWGLALGLPFHIIIGWTGYAYYKDFSTIVLVLYALFLPRATFEAAWRHAVAAFGQHAAAIGRLALIGGVGGYFASLYLRYGTIGIVPSHEGFVWPFTIYALSFLGFAVLFTPCLAVFETDRRIRFSGWLLIIPLAYFANGWSPYLGLKTESAVAMFSNLHTEGGQTNHLLHGVLPGGAGYQDDLVYFLGSDGKPDLDRAEVRYEFDRALAQSPQATPTVYYGGNTQVVDDSWTNTYLQSGWLTRAFLIFKPVDFERPKICSH